MAYLCRMEIKDFINKHENICWFNRYKDGFFYYTIGKRPMTKENELYEFYIPIEDIGNGMLKSEMRAIELMRWINKAIKENTLVKVEQFIRIN